MWLVFLAFVKCIPQSQARQPLIIYLIYSWVSTNGAIRINSSKSLLPSPCTHDLICSIKTFLAQISPTITPRTAESHHQELLHVPKISLSILHNDMRYLLKSYISHKVKLVVLYYIAQATMLTCFLHLALSLHLLNEFGLRARDGLIWCDVLI